MLFFSPLSLKVHAKVALIRRMENSKLKRYGFIGTGNLHAVTARSYTDLGLFTTDEALTTELEQVFSLLRGQSVAKPLSALLVSSYNMRDKLVELIDREIQVVKSGGKGRIRGQLNGLADDQIISRLYEASSEGVEIDLMVREICTLRPGVEGLSENIRVTGVLGRLLQHSRIFEFYNEGEAEYYMGSADWRPRNLDQRVEVVVPIKPVEMRRRLKGILDEILSREDAWVLTPEGFHKRDGELVRAG